MIKRQDYQRGNNNRSNSQNYGPKNPHETGQNRGPSPNRNFHRENTYGQTYSTQNPSSRYIPKLKTEETVEDIKTDILRIEKEIELELKEIRSLRHSL